MSVTRPSLSCPWLQDRSHPARQKTDQWKGCQKQSRFPPLKYRSLIPSLEDPQSAKIDQMEFKESSGFHSSLAMSPSMKISMKLADLKSLLEPCCRIFSSHKCGNNKMKTTWKQPKKPEESACEAIAKAKKYKKWHGTNSTKLSKSRGHPWVYTVNFDLAKFTKLSFWVLGRSRNPQLGFDRKDLTEISFRYLKSFLFDFQMLYFGTTSRTCNFFHWVPQTPGSLRSAVRSNHPAKSPGCPEPHEANSVHNSITRSDLCGKTKPWSKESCNFQPSNHDKLTKQS